MTTNEICGQPAETGEPCAYPAFMVCPIHELPNFADSDPAEPGISASLDPRVLLQRALDHLATANPNPLHLQRLVSSVERLIELKKQLPTDEEAQLSGIIHARAGFGMPPVTPQDWVDYERVLDPQTMTEITRQVMVWCGLDRIPEPLRSLIPRGTRPWVPDDPISARHYPEACRIPRDENGEPALWPFDLLPEPVYPDLPDGYELPESGADVWDTAGRAPAEPEAK